MKQYGYRHKLGAWRREHVRSNRGRARGCDRHHVNPGSRPGPELRAVDRFFKKIARRVGKREIEAQLKGVWLEKQEQLLANLLEAKMLLEAEAFYEHLDRIVDIGDFGDFDCYDPDFEDTGSYYDPACHRRYDELEIGWDLNPDPQPFEAEWRDRWVAGEVSDPQGLDDGERYYMFASDFDDDELEDEWLNYLEPERESAPVTNPPTIQRNLERHRAGERYFRTYKRTVFKPIELRSP